MKRVGLRRQTSTFDPCLSFIFRETGSAAGAFTINIDGTLGCGEPDVRPKIRDFVDQRVGEVDLRGSSFVHVGMELARRGDFRPP